MVVNRARILLGIAEQAGRVHGHTDPVRLFPEWRFMPSFRKFRGVPMGIVHIA